MLHLVYIVLLLSAAFHTGSSLSACEIDWSTAAWVAGGAVVAVVGAPVVVSAAGFTGAGIAAGSVGAKLMSVVAIASGGGVAAGSTVAALQSIGAAGLSVAGTAAVGTVGAAVGYITRSFYCTSSAESKIQQAACK
ncbi:interferon alpha-inducible protein 27-like protein 2A [Hypanus sabinus]|uniref:interferon alpha-inducible protein 27-like protein 2A n=1 Tax=Hypanus sabinus TaxID=79690 RepID=UPI0028C44B9A|nr:interferon alpha-inducible protein 27-like protein 2A [Hypanus sabinus]